MTSTHSFEYDEKNKPPDGEMSTCEFNIPTTKLLAFPTQPGSAYEGLLQASRRRPQPFEYYARVFCLLPTELLACTVPGISILPFWASSPCSVWVAWICCVVASWGVSLADQRLMSADGKQRTPRSTEIGAP